MSQYPNPFGRPLKQSQIGMRGDISSNWSKLSTKEIADLRTNSDLVALVQSKYQLQKWDAQREVERFANGRQL